VRLADRAGCSGYILTVLFDLLTVLQLDPKNVRAKEFVPLLQEKLSLGEC
jgi:hypothetical protein